MTVKHLDHLNLDVADLDESVAWYGRVLGFEPVEHGVYQGFPWTIVRSGEAMLCLYERGVPTPGVGGLHHIGLRITDPEALERTLEAHGVPVDDGKPWRWPHSTSWYVRDPTGYHLELVHWDDDVVAFG